MKEGYKKLPLINQEEFRSSFAQNCFQILNEVFMFERRRFDRFLVAEEKYQLIRQDTGTIGWIIDMNLYGLSYEYIDTDNLQTDREDIGISSVKNKGSFLPGLKCGVIYDINADEGSNPYSIVHFRRRGLMYRSMTSGQKSRLIYMLNNLSEKSNENVGEIKA